MFIAFSSSGCEFNKEMESPIPINLKGQVFLHEKLRHYVYTPAFILELPKHPCTWYTVQLCDGRMVKLRSSSFELIEDLPVAQDDVPLIEAAQILVSMKV